jgi:adenylate cyclase
MTNLEGWIIDQGLRGSDIGSLLSGFSERLVAHGIPLARSYLAMPTVNPNFRVHTHAWTPATGTRVEVVSHERNDGALEVSPIGYMLRNGMTGCHWRLDGPDANAYSVFEDVRRLGGKDYLARLITFEQPTAPALRGFAVAFSCGRDGGLRADEIATIDALMPALGLAAYRMTLFDLTVAMLDTYVGLSAGRRVLSGEIQRGLGATITAALLFADLRGFTTLADTAGASIIGRLDRHLEAMAEPVVEHGGEVLKFLGDGLLAVFPINHESSQEEAGAAAVRAAKAALARNEAVNRSLSGEPSLSLDIALHCGDVFYGNIGAANRLDFTVIGPAVNEASRMEAMCEPLGCSVVMSQTIADASPSPVRSLGRHTLRGLSEPRELFTLAE